MKPSLFFILYSFLSLTDSNAEIIFQPWDGYSTPANMSSNFKREFGLLPLTGQVTEKKKYWSSWYWPLSKGNINLRWNTIYPLGFNLKSPDYSTVLNMKLNELAELAPSEKYDLFMGNYSYSLKKKVSKKVSPYISEWQGICHGWAAAALNHNEPTPKEMINPDGLKIPFGSSDIKALLSYYYAYHYDPVSTHQMGRRCNGRRHCNEDMNAGAFHIVLANKIGLEGTGFIADIDNGREVWNQVVFNYKTSIIDPWLRPHRKSAKNTDRVVRVRTNMRVVFNIVKNSWTPVIGTNLQTYKDQEYEYDLDLDVNGRIIGGLWRSKIRPDFLWLVAPTKSFNGYFSRLGELLQK